MTEKTIYYGESIRKERKKAGLTSKELAERANLSDGHIRYIETGKRETKPKTIILLAKILGMDAKPLLENWLQRNMPQISLSDIDLKLPKKVTIAELKELFGIEEAEKTYYEFQDLRTKDASKLKPIEIMRIKKSLQSCLDFIHELNTNA